MNRAIYRAAQLAKHITSNPNNLRTFAMAVREASLKALDHLVVSDPCEKSNDKNSILNWVDPKDKTGEFKRQASAFRSWISIEPGAEFPAEKDRYHLCEED